MFEMCKNHNKQNIDKCMKHLVNFINEQTNFKTIMCCCGHGKYPPSLIVIGCTNRPFDIFSGVYFKHDQKRFYKKDKEGYYFISEVTK